MSILDDMLQKHANGKSHVRVIEVIWSVMDLGKSANSRMFRSLDPLELTGATCQIRYTHYSPSSPRSCSRAVHRIPHFHSASTYTGPESQLAHYVYRARRFHWECTSAQDALTSLRHCKAWSAAYAAHTRQTGGTVAQTSLAGSLLVRADRPHSWTMLLGPSGV
jgi:hypothetical protein